MDRWLTGDAPASGAELAGVRSAVDALDQAIDKALVPEDLVVYRGLTGKPPKVGAIVETRGFTAVTPDVAAVPADREVILRVALQQGDHAAPITDGLVLPRDAAMKVTSVRDATLPDGRKVRLVDTELQKPRPVAGAPEPLPEQPWFAPGHAATHEVPGSTVPINAERQPWSGHIPDEPPPPPLAPTPDEVAAIRQAAQDTRVTVRDVAEGRAEVAWSWSQADTSRAESLGLTTMSYKGAHLVGTSDEALAPFRAFLDAPGASAQSDEFLALARLHRRAARHAGRRA